MSRNTPKQFRPSMIPEAQGLYDPANEHDSCGVGFLVNMKGEPSHDIVQNALLICSKLAHRGGCGCDLKTGDGAGMLMAMPHKFFGTVAKELGFDLPAAGRFAAGNVFFSPDEKLAAEEKQSIEDAIGEMGQKLLGWRDLPIDDHDLGKASKK